MYESRLPRGVHDGYRSLLWYLLAGTRGGPNRIRILEELRSQPHNAHQLASSLGMDYRTVRFHLRLLERNGLVMRPIGDAYASPYELAPNVVVQFEVVREIRDRNARPRHQTSRSISALDGRPEL